MNVEKLAGRYVGSAGAVSEPWPPDYMSGSDGLRPDLSELNTRLKATLGATGGIENEVTVSIRTKLVTLLNLEGRTLVNQGRVKEGMGLLQFSESLWSDASPSLVVKKVECEAAIGTLKTLGSAFLQKGKLYAALNFYERGMRIACTAASALPDRIELHRHMSAVLSKLGRHAQAIEQLESCIEAMLAERGLSEGFWIEPSILHMAEGEVGDLTPFFTVYSALASEQESAGRFEAALQSRTTAFKLAEMHLGKEHATTQYLKTVVLGSENSMARSAYTSRPMSAPLQLNMEGNRVEYHPPTRPSKPRPKTPKGSKGPKRKHRPIDQRQHIERTGEPNGDAGHRSESIDNMNIKKPSIVAFNTSPSHSASARPSSGRHRSVGSAKERELPLGAADVLNLNASHESDPGSTISPGDVGPTSDSQIERFPRPPDVPSRRNTEYQGVANPRMFARPQSAPIHNEYGDSSRPRVIHQPSRVRPIDANMDEDPTIRDVVDSAATAIQACYRGYRVRLRVTLQAPEALSKQMRQAEAYRYENTHLLPQAVVEKALGTQEDAEPTRQLGRRASDDWLKVLQNPPSVQRRIERRKAQEKLAAEKAAAATREAEEKAHAAARANERRESSTSETGLVKVKVDVLQQMLDRLTSLEEALKSGGRAPQKNEVEREMAQVRQALEAGRVMAAREIQRAWRHNRRRRKVREKKAKNSPPPRLVAEKAGVSTPVPDERDRAVPSTAKRAATADAMLESPQKICYPPRATEPAPTEALSDVGSMTSAVSLQGSSAGVVGYPQQRVESTGKMDALREDEDSSPEVHKGTGDPSVLEMPSESDLTSSLGDFSGSPQKFRADSMASSIASDAESMARNKEERRRRKEQLMAEKRKARANSQSSTTSTNAKSPTAGLSVPVVEQGEGVGAMESVDSISMMDPISEEKRPTLSSADTPLIEGGSRVAVSHSSLGHEILPEEPKESCATSHRKEDTILDVKLDEQEVAASHALAVSVGDGNDEANVPTVQGNSATEVDEFSAASHREVDRTLDRLDENVGENIRKGAGAKDSLHDERYGEDAARAATAIQRIYRGHACKKKLGNEIGSPSAMKQLGLTLWAARSHGVFLRVLSTNQVKEYAAGEIQRVWRGHVSRKNATTFNGNCNGVTTSVEDKPEVAGSAGSVESLTKEKLPGGFEAPSTLMKTVSAPGMGRSLEGVMFPPRALSFPTPGPPKLSARTASVSSFFHESTPELSSLSVAIPPNEPSIRFEEKTVELDQLRDSERSLHLTFDATSQNSDDNTGSVVVREENDSFKRNLSIVVPLKKDSHEMQDARPPESPSGPPSQRTPHKSSDYPRSERRLSVSTPRKDVQYSFNNPINDTTSDGHARKNKFRSRNVSFISKRNILEASQRKRQENLVIQLYAVRLQAIFRGIVERKRLRTEGKMPGDIAKEKHVSAVVIGKIVRGCMVRKRLERQRRAVLLIQSWYHRFRLRRMVRIQAMVRGYITRRRVRKHVIAAMVLQKWYQLVRHDRVLSVQRCIRGWMVRNQQGKKRKAVNLIKAFYMMKAMQPAGIGMPSPVSTVPPLREGPGRTRRGSLIAVATRRHTNYSIASLDDLMYPEVPAKIVASRKTQDQNSLLPDVLAVSGQTYSLTEVASAHRAATLIAARFRAHRQRRIFTMKKASILTLQRWVRRVRAKRQMQAEKASMQHKGVMSKLGSLLGMKTKRTLAASTGGLHPTRAQASSGASSSSIRGSSSYIRNIGSMRDSKARKETPAPPRNIKHPTTGF